VPIRVIGLTASVDIARHSMSPYSHSCGKSACGWAIDEASNFENLLKSPIRDVVLAITLVGLSAQGRFGDAAPTRARQLEGASE